MNTEAAALERQSSLLAEMRQRPPMSAPRHLDGTMFGACWDFCVSEAGAVLLGQSHKDAIEAAFFAGYRAAQAAGEDVSDD